MRKAFATLGIVGVAACIAMYSLSSAPQSIALFQSRQDQQFSSFVSRYSRNYQSQQEYQMRRAIFEDSLRLIDRENANPNNTFKLAVNKFADWTPEEFRSLH